MKTTEMFSTKEARTMSTQEYQRVNSEIEKRIGMVFSQGFTLVTVVVAIWALTITLLGISIEKAKIFDMTNNMWSLLLLGGFMTVLFAVPSFLVLPFAVKSHDNIRVLSSLSAYIKVFYDLPSLLGRWNERGCKDRGCTAWETIHCEVDVPNAKLFNIEYKIITVVSIFFSIALGLTIIVWFGAATYWYGKWNVVWLIIYSVIFVALLCTVVLFTKSTFKYSSTTNSIAAYLHVYLDQYLEDAVDLGIITAEEQKRYSEWINYMSMRDNKLRDDFIKAGKSLRKSPRETAKDTDGNVGGRL